MKDQQRVVLFLCTHNAARSQMAEALLRHYAADRFEAHSAGLEPSGVHPLGVEVMQEIGISLAEQRSKNVSEYLGKLPVHYAITLCRDVETRCPRLWPFVIRDVLSWPMEDPTAVPGSKRERLAAFRRVREAITLRIREWLREEH